MPRSKPLKRAVMLEFLNNMSFTCDSCGKSVKPAFRCRECREIIKLSEAHFHRIIPASMGGKDDLGNIMIVCPKCHEDVDRIRLKRIKHQDRKLTHY